MKIAHMGDKEQSAGVRGNSQAQYLAAILAVFAIPALVWNLWFSRRSALKATG